MMASAFTGGMQLVFKRNKFKGNGGSASPSDSDNPLARRFGEGDDSPTVRLDDDDDTASAGHDARTRIIAESHLETGTAESGPMNDPPAGLLVVVAGPGKGHLLPFGYGMNGIGRDPGMRVVLDFGDERVSRENHAMVTFDSRAGKFYIQHGGGSNLTYLGEEPVLTPQELSHRDRIRLGDTELMFIALCDGDFDWQSPSSTGP